jgi:addiction module HigA family antidote
MRSLRRSWTITEDEAMSIKRDDLDSGRVDFSDVATGKRLPLIHPGEILRHDFLQPMKISVYALSQSMKVARSRVKDIVLGRRGITADTAFRLARYFAHHAGFLDQPSGPPRSGGGRSKASPADRAGGQAAGGLMK